MIKNATIIHFMKGFSPLSEERIEEKLLEAGFHLHPREINTNNGSAAVVVRQENGQESVAFQFYADELVFYPDEFVGKTLAQAEALRHGRDVAYLRS